jgi:hypothetical protein
MGPLTLLGCLLISFLLVRPAHEYSFFQIPPRGGHRCRSHNLFPAWVWGTFIPSERALPGAPKKKGQPVSGLPFPVLRV